MEQDYVTAERKWPRSDSSGARFCALDCGSRSEKNSAPCRSAVRPGFGAATATAAAGALAGRALLARRAVGADACAIGVTDVAAGKGLVALAGIALDAGSAVGAERTGVL